MFGCSQVWRLNTLKLKTNLAGHSGYVSTVTVSPDGSLCASGGKDKVAMLWDLNEGKRLYSLDAGSPIHSLVFSPNRYWLCAATDKCIKVCVRVGVCEPLVVHWFGCRTRFGCLSCRVYLGLWTG